MITQDNTEQREAWNGTQGSSWSRYQDALDEMLRPVSVKLIAAIKPKPGERILDVGCGCGPTTIALARAVGANGHVTGVDISELLLKSAREKSAGLSLPIDWIEADASTHKFAKPFDKIVSRFGVMFFADPVPALAHLKSALTPGGEMIFVCWRTFEENPWVGDVMREAAKIVPIAPRPQSYMPGPFAFGERSFLDGVMKKAGFKSVALEGFEPVLRVPGKSVDERCAFYERIGPMAGVMREASDEQRSKLRGMLRRWVEASFAAGRTTQDSACWFVRAS